MDECGQTGELIYERLSFRARCDDVVKWRPETSELVPKYTPALFKRLDCIRQKVVAKTS